MAKKLVIGCGYVGYQVAKLWLANNDSVSALTRSPDRATQLKADGIVPLIGDVVSPSVLKDIEDTDQVSTLLYAVGFDRSAKHSKHEVYVNGLRRVLDTIGDRVQKFIYVSSISVYGQSDGEWIDEDSPTEPTTDGGRICLEAEQTVRDFFHNQAGNYSLLRFAGIYGPNRILRRLDSLKKSEPIGGNPDAYLNLIHRDDGAASVLACEQNGTPNQVYLVADDQELTRRTYFETLARLVDAPQPTFDQNAPPGNRPAKTGLNKRCRNDRLVNELKCELAYPNVEIGLQQALV